MGTVTKNYAKGGSLKVPKFSLRGTIEQSVGTSSLWWNFKQSGNYVYGCQTSGVSIIDVSDPTSPSIVGTCTAPGVRDCCIIGTNLYTVERLVTGEVNVFDITTPTGSHTATATYAGTPKYSAIDTDGTNLLVAGQLSGAYKFAVADITTGPSGSNEDFTGGKDWENQGVAVYGAYAFFANYDNGIRILDIATMGTVTDNVVPAPSLAGQALRIWEVVISEDGNWLFGTTNVTNGSGNAPERGIVILDISSPTAAMTAADWIVCPAGNGDVDQWHPSDGVNGPGDKPLLGLVKYKEYVLAGNGTQGVSMWNVVNPNKPEYAGKLSIHEVGENITAIGTFSLGSTDYLIFGDGARAVATDGTDKVYICEIHY